MKIHMQTLFYLNKKEVSDFKAHNQTTNKNTNKTFPLLNYGETASFRASIIDKKFENFLTSQGQVTLKEYKEIKKHNPSIIDKAGLYISSQKKSHLITPQINAKAGYLTKNYIDEKYGENNYRIISIGTSPSVLTHSMEILGAEVIYLPISGLKDYNGKANKNIDTALNYLKRKNINKKKLTIVTDFATSGKSLENAEKLIRRIFPKNPIKAKETQSLILYSLEYAIKQGLINCEEENIIAQAFAMDQLKGKCEMLCNVPHFYINDERNKSNKNSISSENATEKEIHKKFETYSTKYARAFELCTINELDKMGLIN